MPPGAVNGFPGGTRKAAERMTVNVRFVCREIVGPARPGAYALAEGATVAQLMASAAAENGTFIENGMEHVIYLVNGRPAAQGTVLREGDQVIVLRKVYGG